MTSRVVIVGGGPGGYEAALVARKAGAEVTLIERQGLGGNAVLTDVVPSKTVIATAEWLTIAGRAPELGIADSDGTADRLRARVDMECLILEVRDEGPGFDIEASLVDPTVPANLDREDGRGLFLMRSLMDSVERIEVPTGSMVRMTLHRE